MGQHSDPFGRWLTWYLVREHSHVVTNTVRQCLLWSYITACQCLLVNSSETKSCQFNSVTLLCTRLKGVKMALIAPCPFHLVLPPPTSCAFYLYDALSALLTTDHKNGVGSMGATPLGMIAPSSSRYAFTF